MKKGYTFFKRTVLQLLHEIGEKLLIMNNVHTDIMWAWQQL